MHIKRTSQIAPNKTSRKSTKAVRLQYGALPYRFALSGELQLLLVTSRGRGRWIMPKGWPIKGLPPRKSAAREAFEEAGVRGRVGAKPIGRYRYDKPPDDESGGISCEVVLFALEVKRQLKDWPEAGQREVRWVTRDEAASLLAEDELRNLVEVFAARVQAAAVKSGRKGKGRSSEVIRIEGMTPERTRAVAALAARIAAIRLLHPVRVAVDGRTASGKTTLADEVAAELRAKGRVVIRTSVDGFHRSRADRYRRGRLSAHGYLDDARDWVAVRELLLEPLGPGGNLLYRIASFDLDRDEPIDSEVQHADEGAVLIVDGTFLQRPELADSWDLVVFVDVAEDIAIRRGVDRDAAAMGGKDRAQEVHFLRYQAAFAIYQARVDPKVHADIVFDNNDVRVPSVS